jgi:Flp pilus assembly protein TadD
LLPYRYLALALARLDDVENSCAAYAKALEMNKDDPVTYVNYAVTLHSNDESDKAREVLQGYVLCSMPFFPSFLPSFVSFFSCV